MSAGTGVQVRVLPSATWARGVAGAWRDRLSAAPALRLCLPSGATPSPVYTAMDGSLAQAEVFLLDEFGGLPVASPGRSETMVRRDLLDHVELPEARFHVPDVDADDLTAACEDYEHRIADGGLDLALLGLGMNGHIGMNEPGSPADSRTRVVELAPRTREDTRRYGVEQPPTWGITVGLGTLLEARELWLLVDGRRKRDILDRALNGPVDPSCPASLLRTHSRAVVWVSNTAAP